MTTRKMLSWLLALVVIFSQIPVGTLAEALPVPTQPQLQTETPPQEPEELPSEPETIATEATDPTEGTATEPEEPESILPEKADPIPEETEPAPENRESVAVSFSVTTEDGFLSVEDTEILVAAQQLMVPCFDLTAYGMEQKTNGVSLAHGLIYATEVLCCGLEAQNAGQGYLAQLPDGENTLSRLWGMEGDFACFLDDVRVEEECASVSLEENSRILLAWIPEETQAVAGNLSAPDEEISAGESLTLITGENQDVFYIPAAEGYDYGGAVTSWLWAGTADEAGVLMLEDLEPGEYCFAVPGKWEEETCCLPAAVSVTVSGEDPVAALTPVPTVQGDVNGDGVLDATDGACLAAFVNGTAELTEKALHLADMNDDGKINMLDVALIYRIVNDGQSLTQEGTNRI